MQRWLAISGVSENLRKIVQAIPSVHNTTNSPRNSIFCCDYPEIQGSKLLKNACNTLQTIPLEFLIFGIKAVKASNSTLLFFVF